MSATGTPSCALRRAFAKKYSSGGFLLQYLRQHPWGLNLTLAMVISSIIFGLQHLYLGSAGAVQTTVAGFLFCLLFVLTGNLVVPIVFHAISDLRMLLVLPPPADPDLVRA